MKSEQEIKDRFETMKKTLRWNKTIVTKKDDVVLRAQEEEISTLKWVLGNEEVKK